MQNQALGRFLVIGLSLNREFFCERTFQLSFDFSFNVFPLLLTGVSLLIHLLPVVLLKVGVETDTLQKPLTLDVTNIQTQSQVLGRPFRDTSCMQVGKLKFSVPPFCITQRSKQFLSHTHILNLLERTNRCGSNGRTQLPNADHNRILVQVEFLSTNKCSVGQFVIIIIITKGTGR